MNLRYIYKENSGCLTRACNIALISLYQGNTFELTRSNKSTFTNNYSPFAQKPLFS